MSSEHSLRAPSRDPDFSPEADPVVPGLGTQSRSITSDVISGVAAGRPNEAALARMEARIAFTALLDQLEDSRLATDRLEWRSNSGLRGLKRLPIAFRSVGGAA